MCVVEKDVWSYPVGDGLELRGDDMPNPFAMVEDVCWGGWLPPWRRGLKPEETFELDSEPELVAFWLDQVGITLFYVQLGYMDPFALATLMPEPRWLHWAITWIEEAARVEPPPRRKLRQRAAFERRERGVVCLLAAMMGLHTGLERILEVAVDEHGFDDEELDGEPVLWS
jgi:hypothetical protein